MADTEITVEPEQATETTSQEQATTSTTSGKHATETPFHPAMKELLDKLIQEVQDMAVEAGEKDTCIDDPNLNVEDPQKAGMANLGLELESELEALLATPLVTLPDDPALHLGLASEKMALAADQSARTLQYYKNRVEELEQKRKKYEDMVRKAASVDQALDRLLHHQSTEEGRRVALEKRYNDLSVIFRCLRRELHFILETYNPEELSNAESIKSMEDMLDGLVSQMLLNPNDPYVDIEEGMEEGNITLLLCANLITRHPQDPTRIRFVDPRT